MLNIGKNIGKTMFNSSISGPVLHFLGVVGGWQENRVIRLSPPCRHHIKV